MNIEEEKRKWFEENQPLGKDLGYPDCCIKEFCDQPPVLLHSRKETTQDDLIRFEAACSFDGKFSGFIPCTHHAKEILAGKISLASLIKDRKPIFPRFPSYARY